MSAEQEKKDGGTSDNTPKKYGRSEDELQKIREETEQILELIPAEGIPVEERARRNAIIRERLPVASDRTIIYLALERKHQLSRQELLARLEQHEIGYLPDLFEIAEAEVYYKDIRPKSDQRFFRLAYDNVIQLAVNAPQEEVLEAAQDHFNTILTRDSSIFEDTITPRPDALEIIEKIREQFREHRGNSMMSTLGRITKSAKAKTY